MPAPYNNHPHFESLVKKNRAYWEELYDRYSPVMYGIILEITRCEQTACVVLKSSFLGLKNIKLPENNSLYFYLWKYAGMQALSYLEEHEAPEAKIKHAAFLKNCSPIRTLCFNQNSIIKNAPVYSLPDKELQQKIQWELSERISA